MKNIKTHYLFLISAIAGVTLFSNSASAIVVRYHPNTYYGYPVIPGYSVTDPYYHYGYYPQSHYHPYYHHYQAYPTYNRYNYGHYYYGHYYYGHPYQRFYYGY